MGMIGHNGTDSEEYIHHPGMKLTMVCKLGKKTVLGAGTGLTRALLASCPNLFRYVRAAGLHFRGHSGQQRIVSKSIDS